MNNYTDKMAEIKYKLSLCKTEVEFCKKLCSLAVNKDYKHLFPEIAKLKYKDRFYLNNHSIGGNNYASIQNSN